MEAPPRMSAPDCEAAYGRRPVVAVLDTGARAHQWLDVRADPAAPCGYATIPDGFVAVDEAMQDIIFTDAELAVLVDDGPRQLIESPWDTPISQAPLIGELNSTTGHGTFIAGIVRQVVPDARVLAVRIMHSDGIVNEGDLISALGLLVERIEAAEEGDLAAMVDVLSLSLGYFSESAADEIYSSGLWSVIDMLLAMGVLVVAAAGNFSTSRKFYPAAFAERPAGPAHAPLISVGALNPNGSKALFSDGGRWVTAWAAGAAVVSTFPPDVNGSLDPEISMPAHPANTVPAGSRCPPSASRSTRTTSAVASRSGAEPRSRLPSSPRRSSSSCSPGRRPIPRCGWTSPARRPRETGSPPPWAAWAGSPDRGG